MGACFLRDVLRNEESRKNAESDRQYPHDHCYRACSFRLGISKNKTQLVKPRNPEPNQKSHVGPPSKHPGSLIVVRGYFQPHRRVGDYENRVSDVEQAGNDEKPPEEALLREPFEGIEQHCQQGAGHHRTEKNIRATTPPA